MVWADAAFLNRCSDVAVVRARTGRPPDLSWTDRWKPMCRGLRIPVQARRSPFSWSIMLHEPGPRRPLAYQRRRETKREFPDEVRGGSSSPGRRKSTGSANEKHAKKESRRRACDGETILMGTSWRSHANEQETMAI